MLNGIRHDFIYDNLKLSQSLRIPVYTSSTVPPITSERRGEILFERNIQGTDGVVRYNNGSSWTTVGGSGTVTSVGITDSTGIFNILNSPITTSGNISLTLAAAPTNGRLLIGNGSTYTASTLTAGSGISIVNGPGSITISASGAGTGTVTSVGLSMPSIFTVSGSPITTAGTLAVSSVTQAARTFYAGPISGAAAVPSFRLIASSDLPMINLSSGVTGVLPLANGGTNLSSIPTNGQVLIGNGTGYVLSTLTAGTGVNITNGSGSITISSTTGTVTSVGLSMPSIFSVSGSPVTTSGTLSVTANSQSANTVFAGPASGIAATPTFRPLVVADIPAISLTSGVSGVLPISNGGTNISTTPTNGQILIGNGIGYTLSTITAGTGVTITNEPGSITLSSSTGTVTSVGLSMPSIFSVSGTPITTSGTLSVTSNVQPSNSVYAGPIAGISAIPTFRSLVADDIPTISLTTKVSGILPIANGGTNLSTTPTNGQVLIGNGTGYTLSTITAGTGISVTNGVGSITIANTGGTVTSVALTAPSIFSVTGSPITTSGTINITSNTQSANTVYAGPTAGGPAVPTFRTLVADDIPTISLTTKVSGMLPIANGGTNLSTTPTNGQLLIGNGAGYTLSTLTAGTGVSITNASGSITIDSGGVITMAAFGNSPNAAAGTISSASLTLQPASESFPGGISMNAQTLGLGDKTIQGDLIVTENVQLPATTDADHGNLVIGITRIHDYSQYVEIKNFFAGADAGNYTGTHSYNIGIGTEALSSLTSGASNICIGHGLSRLESGSHNTFLNGGGQLLTGNNNLIAGGNAPGNNYVSNESNNICFNNPGVMDDQGVIRIGTSPTQSSCYIAGILGVPIAGGNAVYVNASGQLGTGNSVNEMGSIGNTPNANGATIIGNTLHLEPATADFGGVLTAGPQTIGGIKTFAESISASNLSGTNTGDMTLSDIGTTPNANGATITGSVLNLEPATADFGGVVTTGPQTITGEKTLNSLLTVGTAGSTDIDVTFTNTTKNRKIVLHPGSNNDNQYYGFGINPSTLRYQVGILGGNHVFYAGNDSTTSNELFRVVGTGGVRFPTTGGTATTLNYFESTTHSTVFTCGGASTASIAVVFERIGSTVTMKIPNVSITFSAAGVFANITAIPVRFRVTTVTQWPAIVIDNNIPQLGRIQLTTGGGIVIANSVAGGNFTAGSIGWPSALQYQYSIL